LKMRLIDADKLLRDTVYNTMRAPYITKRDVEEAPTVDAEPVRHGRWIEAQIPANTTGHGGVGQDKKKGWLCSNCRCAFDAKLLWCDHYCPNCGAEMDGDTNADRHGDS